MTSLGPYPAWGLTPIDKHSHWPPCACSCSRSIPEGSLLHRGERGGVAGPALPEGGALSGAALLTTSQPVLRKSTTPKMLIMHDVNTPSQVPNSTGSHMDSWAFHQGRCWARAPCNQSTLGSGEWHQEAGGGGKMEEQEEVGEFKENPSFVRGSGTHTRV